MTCRRMATDHEAAVTATPVRFRLPRSARIISSDDFGRLLHNSDPGSLRLGRDAVTLCAAVSAGEGQVRVGFTVGKRNAPRSVDRVLVKRVMRECSRHAIPELSEMCRQQSVQVDVSLRLRASVRDVGRSISVTQTKELIRNSTNACLRGLKKRLKVAIDDYKKSIAQ